MIERYGADALRLYMIYSPVVRAEDLRFQRGRRQAALRHLLIPWWNAYSFFVTYANIDGSAAPGERGRSGGIQGQGQLQGSGKPAG
jgi:isoleucyl-tRNA synthetase